MTSSASPKPLDIAVVGGGIAGITLVIGLLKQNIQVTCYEAAHHFGEIGAGVGFGANSLRAMSLIDPAIKDAFSKVATTNQWESKRNLWLDVRHGEDKGEKGRTGTLIHSVECPGGQSTLHRADFLDEMVKLVPSSIARFGKRLVGLEDLGHDVLRLKFRDGTEATHHAVIGCDGIKSVTRQYILGSENSAAYAVYSGKYCYRGLIPMDKALPVLGEELAMNNTMYVGNHKHIIMFPVQKGRTMNVAAITSGETWDHKDWEIPSSHEEILADFKDWGEPIQKVLRLMGTPDIWALFEDPPAETYYKGRVCMTGDAAHASTPHQASGAGMAIEDAYVLSNLLGQVEDISHIESAFRAFDAVRRGRTQKLVATSHEAGELWAFELEGVGDDVVKFSDNLDKRMHWIWNEDLEADVEKGKALMSQ